jgi:alkyl sulfatase BDS1-like metallo-beta-lactamase superfamily hydrolase
MGGAEALLRRARESHEGGEYRWVAEVVNHLVTAEPGHAAARALLADAYEQLGWHAESAPWRNIYLSGAQELRRGVARPPPRRAPGAARLRPMTVEQVFDWLGVRLNPERAGDRRIEIDLSLTDTGERWAFGVENATLQCSEGRRAERPDAALALDRAAFDELFGGDTAPARLVEAGRARITGAVDAISGFLALLDEFPFWFDLVPGRPGG